MTELRIADLAAVDRAQEKVEAAALRSIKARHFADDADAHSADEVVYSGEMLALAARDLVRTVDQLPKDQQPVGWSD